MLFHFTGFSSCSWYVLPAAFIYVMKAGVPLGPPSTKGAANVAGSGTPQVRRDVDGCEQDKCPLWKYEEGDGKGACLSRN